MKRSERPLWTCPRCGASFTGRNMWHSCERVPLETHFEGRPRARELFDAFLAAVEEHGPVTVVSTKSRIAIMRRVRFAHVLVRRDWIRVGLWQTVPRPSPRVARIETYGPRAVYHFVDLRRPDDIDDEVRALIAESRRIGDQEHLDDRG